MRYHIGKNGPSPCRAKKSCPFGGDTGYDNHYATQEEARIAFEHMNKNSMLPRATTNFPQLRKTEAESLHLPEKYNLSEEEKQSCIPYDERKATEETFEHDGHTYTIRTSFEKNKNFYLMKREVFNDKGMRVKISGIPQYEQFYFNGIPCNRVFYEGDQEINVHYYDNGHVETVSRNVPEFHGVEEEKPTYYTFYPDGSLQSVAFYYDEFLHRENEPAEIIYYPNGNAQEENWYSAGGFYRNNGEPTSLLYNEEGKLVEENYTIDADAAWFYDPENPYAGQSFMTFQEYKEEEYNNLDDSDYLYEMHAGK